VPRQSPDRSKKVFNDLLCKWVPKYGLSLPGNHDRGGSRTAFGDHFSTKQHKNTGLFKDFPIETYQLSILVGTKYSGAL